MHEGRKSALRCLVLVVIGEEGRELRRMSLTVRCCAGQQGTRFIRGERRCERGVHVETQSKGIAVAGSLVFGTGILQQAEVHFVFQLALRAVSQGTTQCSIRSLGQGHQYRALCVCNFSLGAGDEKSDSLGIRHVTMKTKGVTDVFFQATRLVFCETVVSLQPSHTRPGQTIQFQHFSALHEIAQARAVTGQTRPFGSGKR